MRAPSLGLGMSAERPRAGETPRAGEKPRAGERPATTNPLAWNRPPSGALTLGKPVVGYPVRGVFLGRAGVVDAEGEAVHHAHHAVHPPGQLDHQRNVAAAFQAPFQIDPRPLCSAVESSDS